MISLLLLITVALTDGDTIKIGQVPYRLAGMDAPEISQMCLDSSNNLYKCGVISKKYLYTFVYNKTLKCDPSGTSYKRIVATCYADGEDIGKAMVRSGWAVSAGKYAMEEQSAKLNQRGIWAGVFVYPSTYRKSLARR